MILSLALVFLCGLSLKAIFEQLKLPGLLGMLLAGVLLGPYALGLLSLDLLGISVDIRQIALVIILTRAGLSLELKDLKKVGRPALLMCFVPACFEILGMMLLAPMFFHISIVEAAIMGTVVAAVSPAVVVPRMLKLMHDGYGTKKKIPQLIMAGSSVDDVFVIVLFTSLLGIAKGEAGSSLGLLAIPVSIVLGILAGILTGACLNIVFRRIKMRSTIKSLVLLSVAFLLVFIEKGWGMVPFSGLLATMSMGITLLALNAELAKKLAKQYEKLWVIAEVLLFVLVGASVDIQYAFQAGGAMVLLVLLVLLFRMAGVFVCLIRTRLTMKERLFCMIAYMPKATVQAAIGGIPLSMGLACGQMVLTVAVVSILVTAPLGAIGIDKLYPKLLNKEHNLQEGIEEH